ncbi:MAG: TonB-dependent receptor [Amphiplicatus sp.]
MNAKNSKAAEWRAALLRGCALAPVAAAIVFAGGEAAAQEAASDEVVATGSRIKNANMVSPSPVTTVDAAQIEARGTIRIEDMLNTLPQVSPAEGSSRANEAAGTATVDLRGLGAERTLVLVNGKRLPFGSPIAAPADLNQVPSQLIERVDVLTGGASAVYGADAVAGVVNFILKDDFEGLQVDFQTGAYQTSNSSNMMESVLNEFGQPVPGAAFDGRSFNLNLLIGANTPDGRGNVTGYFSWRNQNEVLQGDRIWSACGVGSRAGGNEFTCSGSGTTNPAQFANSAPVAVPFRITLDENGQPRDFVSPDDTYNFGPINHFIRPNERFSFGFTGHYDLADRVEAYAEFGFNDDSTVAQIAPAGIFFGQTDSINCDNPFLSAALVQIICTNNGFGPNDDAPLNIGKRNVEGGGRRNSIRHTSYRFVGGFRGDIDSVWSYDVFGQYGSVQYSDQAENFFNLNRVANALEVRNDPVTGQPACQVAIDGVDPDCVPYNPFALDGVTDEALDYIQSPGFREGAVTQKVFGATLVGDLTSYGVQSPFANQGLQAVFGFEYREETLSQTNDFLTRTGALGNPRADVSGSIAAYEFFTEMQIPLAQGATLIEDFSINGAYRYSDFYRSTGAQSTYAIGFNYSPTSDYRIRGQYQRATRSPNPIELYSPQNRFEFTLPELSNGMYDPCAGAAPARSFAECALTGVTASQYGQIFDSIGGQFNNLTGGNPDLEVESSDTFTLGLVATPGFIPGFTFSIDYFNITVDDFIATVPEELALNNCMDTGDDFFCGLIKRDPVNGALFGDEDAYVLATNVNTGSLKTAGFDFVASYRFDIGGLGDVRVDYLSTYLSTLEKVPLPGEPAFECAGFFASTNSACGVSSPTYRHRLPVTWYTPWMDMSAQVTWRYFGAVNLLGTTGDSLNTRLSAQNYVDFTLRSTVTEGVDVRFGVNNLLDNNPPISTNVGSAGGSFGNGNTFPQVYDSLGRFLFLGVTATF